MLIELIGCTGAGKTTLAAKMVAAGRNSNPRVSSGDDVVLQRFALGWLPGQRLRTIAIYVLSFLNCLLRWRQHRNLVNLVLSTLSPLPISRFQKLYLLRVALRRIGTYDVLRRATHPGQVVILDEGPLVIASHLFVHCDLPPDWQQLEAFLRVVPLPDLAVYLRERPAVLIARTLERGHKRIPPGSERSVTAFAGKAVDVYETLVDDPSIRDRLIVVQHGRPAHSCPSVSLQPSTRKGVKLVCASLAADATHAIQLEHACP